MSLLPVLSQNQPLIRDAIYWHFPHHRNTKGAMGAAIRCNDWKLIYLFEEDSNLLFNLKNDPKEEKNLYETMPNKAKELKEKLEKWQLKVDAEMPSKQSKR